MKVIELAEKVRNNEIMPKHIRYSNEDLYFDGYSYYDKEGNNDILDILAMNNRSLIHLFDEVEIIEEDKKIKKIEKLYKYNDKEVDEKEKDMYFENILKVYDDSEYEIDESISFIVDKINEIIDYLEEKE